MNVVEELLDFQANDRNRLVCFQTHVLAGSSSQDQSFIKSGFWTQEDKNCNNPKRRAKQIVIFYCNINNDITNSLENNFHFN